MNDFSFFKFQQQQSFRDFLIDTMSTHIQRKKKCEYVK